MDKLMELLQLDGEVNFFNDIIACFAQKALAGFAMKFYEVNGNKVDGVILLNDDNIELTVSSSGNDYTIIRLQGQSYIDKIRPRVPRMKLLNNDVCYVKLKQINKTVICFPIIRKSLEINETAIDFSFPRYFRIVPQEKMDPIVKQAVDGINDSLKNGSSQAAILEPFYSLPMGWHIPLVIDKESTLEDRRRKHNLEGEDCWGFYECNECDNKQITIYYKAMEEFQGNNGISLPNLIASVLAHELFHALQDFCAGLFYCKTKKGKIFSDGLEGYAEFFGLRYVKDVLRDGGLFSFLVGERKKEISNQVLDPYTAALNRFGDITKDESVTGFLDAYDDWKKESVKGIY